jgi:hypothetical protein
MTRFFLPPLAGGGPATERAYRRLRDHAEVCAGAVSRERRIERVQCRRSGRDCLLSVGELDSGNGRIVAAIIQVGRDTYTVHYLAARPGDSPEPTLLRKPDVYSVTDFQ